MKNKKQFHIEYGDYGILYALVIFWLILIATDPNFRGFSFFQTILTKASLNAICGIGMTYAVISGAFDLSVASQVALNGVVLTLILPRLGMFPSIVVILLLGALMGTINGTLIAKLRIPAFIATLAMQMAYRAIAQMVNSKPVIVENQVFKKLATYKIGGAVPTVFLVCVLLGIVGTVILRKTKLGRNILAIGNSRSAAMISGIHVARTEIMIYMLVGLFTAASSIMFVSYLGSSNYGMQSGLEFSVISAVVLGGTALKGGKGSIFNTIVAAIFLITIRSAMDSFGVDSYWQRVVEGIILIIAFSITEIRNIISKFTVQYQAQKELSKKTLKPDQG